MRFLLLLLIALPLTAWERVYLASYPRSGNHWVRYLVEEVTGVATGSVYGDTAGDHEPLTVDHDPTTQPWGGCTIIGGYEGTRSQPSEEYPVLVKTHYPVMYSPRDNPHYLRTIRLVRDPRDAIRSYAGGEKIPPYRLAILIQEWTQFQQYWNRQHDVITIRYEDLKSNPERELSRIIAALGYPVDPIAIKRAVDRYPPRPSRLDQPDVYTEQELKLFDHWAGDQMAIHGYGENK